MQILRLLPDQIMEHWHFIKESMEKAFPPVAHATGDVMLIIQEQFLLGDMQCWFGVESLDSAGIVAVMTTKVVYDEVTKTKNMLIFSVTSYMMHSEELWFDGYETLRAYARSKGCNKIISFSDNPQVMHIAKKLGANVEWKLIQLDI